MPTDQKTRIRKPASEAQSPPVVIGLNAAIIAVFDERPHVLVVNHDTGGAPNHERVHEGLPSGPFEPIKHRTMEIGLRNWVAEQTKLSLGYVEQLYTFGDRGRHATLGTEPHVVSVGYLALTRRSPVTSASGPHWQDWYRYFPWEDWRKAKPSVLTDIIEPKLAMWAKATESPDIKRQRSERASLYFGLAGLPWHEEQVLERYELLYEAGLVYEARRDRPHLHGPPSGRQEFDPDALGAPMVYDHRRILATAMGRLRGKLEYRPLVFELMPPAFTLFELQRTVEAVAGVRIHKQNFRRLLARTGLLEPTGRMSTATGGRPAVQFRFRREVLRERPPPAMRLPTKSYRG